MQGVDEFIFVLSPQNPTKEEKDSHLAEKLWQELLSAVKNLNEGMEENRRIFSASNIEFSLPKPLYTYNTLKALKREYPDKNFSILIGADNLAIIERWYMGLEILKDYPVLVYPREGADAKQLCKKYNATYIDAPFINISSTFIREQEKNNIDCSIYRADIS